MNRPFRQLSATAVAVVSATAIAACGSSSGSSSQSRTTPSARGGRGGLTLTATEQACLKRKGVTFTGGPGGGRPPSGGSGKPPSGGSGAPKGFRKGRGARPASARNGAGSARFKKQQTALKACGVSFGGGGPGGPPAS